MFDRPEFRTVEPGPGRALGRHLWAFFEWLGGLHDASPPLFWLLLVACLAALVALVAVMVLQVRKVFAPADGGRAGPAAAGRREQVSGAYRAEADRRAAAGDFTEAVRYLFLSLVYRLDERGRVEFHREYTNHEYLGLVADRPGVGDALRVLVDALDDHWYAQRPCPRARYDACRAVYDRLAA